MQASVSEFENLNAHLIALTAEPPDSATQMIAKQGLSYPILIDSNFAVARKLGIVYTMPPDMDSLYQNFGVDLRQYNRTKNPELPIPATYVIDTKGIIRYAYLNEDYTYRANPTEVIAVLQEL